MIWPNVAGPEWCGIAETLSEGAAAAQHLRKRRKQREKKKKEANVFLPTNSRTCKNRIEVIGTRGSRSFKTKELY